MIWFTGESSKEDSSWRQLVTFSLEFMLTCFKAGAHDFEKNSDSLYWEVEHGWQGLLVEPHPLSFSFGVSK